MLTIREAITELMKGEFEIYSKVCEVTSVDKDKKTINVKPLDGDAEIFDVKLNANEEDEAGIIIYPVEGTNVICTFISNSTAFMSHASEVDEMIIDGGKNGGFTITPELKIQLDLVIARITALEAAITAYASGQSGVTDGATVFLPLSPALKSLSSAIGALPPQGNFSKIENKKLKH